MPDPAARRDASILRVATLAYLLLVGLMSWCQRGYCNADFVAYVTIARAPLEHVGGYWSPLYSWLMTPLLWMGVGDLVAGRLVLVIAGVGYLFAVHALARQLAPERGAARSAVLVAAQVVAVTQAGLWATHLLGPDLVAAALMLAALAMMIATPWSATRAVAVGAIFGLAYFGKAFMLPFAALVTPVLLWLRRSMHAPGAPAVRWWRDCALVLLGLTIVAGPWIAVLSVKYGGFTFSTAGAANHANLGPHARGLDLLWNPLLEANYILEPHFGPDWSPFASLRNFGHQVFLVAFNVWKALGQIVGYVVLLAVAIVWRRACVRRGAVPPLAAIERARLRQCLLASAIYLLGYSAVDIERRYHVPMLAPLLAVAALSLLAPCLPSARWSMARTLGAAVLSMVPFAGQEIRLLWVTCDRHPQSWNVEGPRADVRALRDAGWDGAAFAASDWHRGLAVAYVSGALGAYLGRPLAPTPAERGHQLRRAGARYFVQFAPGAGEAEACLDPAWRPAPSSRRSGVQVLIDTRGVEPAANSGPEAFRGR